MKIVWLSWKDKHNPMAGGAEVVGHEIRKRLVRDGHEVVLLSAGFLGAEQKEMIDGYEVVRLGKRFTVYYHAWKYYRKYLKINTDIVIDEMNTVPFFARFYSKKKTFLFVHQLCRQIWFYEMFFPLNLIGYLLEPIYLWLLRESEVITVSTSTKNDLVKYGFNKEKISIIKEGIEWVPIASLDIIQKEKTPTIVSIGSVRMMKRTDHVIQAYLLAKKQIPNLGLVIAGQSVGRYGQRVKRMAARNNIKFLDVISSEQKKILLKKANLFALASVKEGWGLVVTEANSYGTPAIAYNVDGLRDSIQNKTTGLLVENGNIEKLSKGIVDYFNNKEKYLKMPHKALEFSREINFDNSFKDFKIILDI